MHQQLLSAVIHSLRVGEGPTERLFVDQRWERVENSAPRQSWVSILDENGFPCGTEVDTGCRIDPVADIVGIGRYAEATRDQLLRLTKWLAASVRSCKNETMGMAQVDQGPLTWALVRLSVNNVQFDYSCLDAEVEKYAAFKVTTKDSCTTKIELDGSLIGTVNQGRF